MALVEALPTPGADLDPRLLAAACRPGRIRGIATDIVADALAHPTHADARIRHALRDARALHSRERRLVADGIADLIRYRGVLDALLGGDGIARWLGWLVLRGLAPEQATEAHPGPDYAAVAGLPGTGAHLDLAAVAGIDPGVTSAFAAVPDVGAFLAASNERAPMCLRVNGDPDALIAALARRGVTARRGRWAPRALIVDGNPDLRSIPEFRDGGFEVQDEGSQLVAAAVDPVGRVLDLCAGAGGKTLALAGPGVELVAADIRQGALDELRRRASRAGVRVRTEVIPATGPLPLSLAADRVLVDAPCSGSGVLRRHPAYRLRWTADGLAALTALQRDLLARAAPLVRPGGRLVYATCSVLPSENDDVVGAFLAAHPGWRRVGDPVRTRPDTHGTDAFFAAALAGPGQTEP